MLNKMMTAIAAPDNRFDTDSRHGATMNDPSTKNDMAETKRDRLAFHLFCGAERMPEVMPATIEKPQITEHKIRIGIEESRTIASATAQKKLIDMTLVFQRRDFMDGNQD